MKCLYLKDFYNRPKNIHNLYDEGTRTLSVYLTPKKFGLTIEINYGITIHFLFIKINYLE